MRNYNIKTFLYYFSPNSLIVNIPGYIKILIYVFLNIFVLINNIYIINIFIAFFFFLFLLVIGFVKFRIHLFKLLTVSLLLFFFIASLLQGISLQPEYISQDLIFSIFSYVFPFFSKWLLINFSGLLLFVNLSQEELIQFLVNLRLNYRIVLPITIAFNMISRLLESIEDMNISLNSRNFSNIGVLNLLRRIKYIFISMLIDNIEYISSLRATYAFDIVDIRKTYEKRK